jgi:hypothetical protein
VAGIGGAGGIATARATTVGSAGAFSPSREGSDRGVGLIVAGSGIYFLPSA